MNTGSHPTVLSQPLPPSEPISQAIVSAVAELEGVSELDVQSPLTRVIDPDALDQLVESMDGSPGAPLGVVTFTWNGYRIHVEATGSIELSARKA